MENRTPANLSPVTRLFHQAITFNCYLHFTAGDFQSGLSPSHVVATGFSMKYVFSPVFSILSPVNRNGSSHKKHGLYKQLRFVFNIENILSPCKVSSPIFREALPERWQYCFYYPVPCHRHRECAAKIIFTLP